MAVVAGTLSGASLSSLIQVSTSPNDGPDSHRVTAPARQVDAAIEKLRAEEKDKSAIVRALLERKTIRLKCWPVTDETAMKADVLISVEPRKRSVHDSGGLVWQILLPAGIPHVLCHTAVARDGARRTCGRYRCRCWPWTWEATRSCPRCVP